MTSILCLNNGSSSLRFALYELSDPLVAVLTGTFDRIGSADTQLSFTNVATNQEQQRTFNAPDHAACVRPLLQLLEGKDIAAIGHRVVHGGPRYRETHRVDGVMLDELQGMVALDPNHLPVAIALMKTFASAFPEVPQFACFDTAFHRNMPRVAKMLPIPRRYEAQGVQRYGFHGLSYAYLMEELARLGDASAAKGRVVLAHLGNGASMAAVLHGKGIDTSMGFTPMGGLMMGTRSGDLDPGLISYLMNTEHMTASQFHRMTNHESGLLGISESSADMRDLLHREPTDERAAEAVALFCYQATKWIGSYAAALGGLDTLVFAGGIGENCAAIRLRICSGLEFLGIDLDDQRNSEHEPLISKATAHVNVRVIRTNEEAMIAKAVGRALRLEIDSGGHQTLREGQRDGVESPDSTKQ